MSKFSVTYEIWTPEDIDHGETDNRGFVVEDVSLRDAARHMEYRANEANEWPVTSPRWLTHDNFSENYQTGATESRSLHFPANLTSASRLRIARLLGVRC